MKHSREKLSRRENERKRGGTKSWKRGRRSLRGWRGETRERESERVSLDRVAEGGREDVGWEQGEEESERAPVEIYDRR